MSTDERVIVTPLIGCASDAVSVQPRLLRGAGAILRRITPRGVDCTQRGSGLTRLGSHSPPVGGLYAMA